MTLEEAFKENTLYRFHDKFSTPSPIDEMPAEKYFEKQEIPSEKPKEKDSTPKKEMEQSVEENKRLNFLEESLRTIEKDTAGSYDGMNKKLEQLTSQLTKLTDKIESLEKQQVKLTQETPKSAESAYKTVAATTSSSNLLEKPEIRSSYIPAKFPEKSSFGLSPSPTQYSSFPIDNLYKNAQTNSPHSFGSQYQQQSQPLQPENFFSTPQTPDINAYAIGRSPYNANQAYSATSLQNQVQSFNGNPRFRGSYGGTDNYNSNVSGQQQYSGFGNFGVDATQDQSNNSESTPKYKTVTNYINSDSNIGMHQGTRNYYADDGQNPSAVEAESYGF